MKNRMLRRVLANGIALVLTLPLLSVAAPATGIQPLPPRDSATSPASPGNAGDSRGELVMYGRLPLSFEANHGQTDSRVKFLSRGRGPTVFLTSTEAVRVLTQPAAKSTRGQFGLVKPNRTQQGTVAQTVVRTRFVGANPAPRVAGLEELPGRVNYFIGNDPAKWRTNVPTYAKVRYENVYRGIDLVYYGNQRQLEYDFVVRPGADPKAIALDFQGADKLEVDAQGDLVLHTAAGTIRQRKPVIYQEVDGVRREFSGGYVLKGAHRVGFQVARYDARRPLVIDPVLVYSTYLGGASDDLNVFGIKVDASGNAYVAGSTASANFPTTAGAFQTTLGGGGFGLDAFVAKLNPTGSGLVYSTYLGGSADDDFGLRLALDAAGNAYVAGQTFSADFPTTPSAFQTVLGGARDGFVTKLNSTGSALVYSTYLGGSGEDGGIGIAVDASGNAYVSGFTESTNFPTTPGVFQSAFGGGPEDTFVTKLNPLGIGLVYSTYFGGSSDELGLDVAIDATGNVYVTGSTLSTDFPTTPGALQTIFGGVGPLGFGDAFVTKLNPTGSTLVYSTYLGGSGDDEGSGIAVDAGGNAYVTGDTSSTNFATTAGASQSTLGGVGPLGLGDAFVTKLNPTGSTLVYSTYLGGSGDDEGSGIAVDAGGNAYVTGDTSSTNFSTTAGASQSTLGGVGPLGLGDAFVTKLNPTGSTLVYSTYLGGSGDDEGSAIAVDAAGNAYVTGQTNSTNFPTTAGTFQPAFGGAGPIGAGDAFVAKISPNTPSGNNVSVSAGSGVTVTFATVSSSGDTTATTSSTGPTPPAGFSLGASSYYGITTTATFGPPVTICITYDPAQFNDPSTPSVDT